MGAGQISSDEQWSDTGTSISVRASFIKELFILLKTEIKIFWFFCFMKEEKINFGHLMAFYFHFCQRRKNLNIFPHFQQQYEWRWIFQIDFWDLQIWKGCQLKLRSLHLCWRAQLLLNQVWTRQSTGWSFFFTGSPPPKQVNLG